MADTSRALCAELADELQGYKVAHPMHCRALLNRARALLAQPEPQGPMPEVDDILRLAAIIRRVDGNHDKGAAALAEAILSHPDSRWQHAQPKPQGPTDEELVKHYDRAVTSAIAIRVAVRALTNEDRDAATVAGLRAVLARWGRPAIEPVPVSERLPGPEDCDAEGLCWWFSRDITAWCLCFAADGDSSEWTHWLPHWALPVPVVEDADA